MRTIEIETARAAAAAAAPPRLYVGLVNSTRATGTVDGEPAFIVSVPIGRVLTDPESDAWNRKNAAAADAETDAATARVSELIALDPGVTAAREKLARLRASVAETRAALAADQKAGADAQAYWLRALAAGGRGTGTGRRNRPDRGPPDARTEPRCHPANARPRPRSPTRARPARIPPGASSGTGRSSASRRGTAAATSRPRSAAPSR